MKLTVYDIPPSNNKYMGNSHSFNVYRRDKEKWHYLVKAAIGRAKKPRKPLEKAIVHITYYFKDKRRRDPDNYSGKLLLDPLVREGILADDNFKVVELRLSGSVDRGNPRTEIEIVKLEEKVWQDLSREDLTTSL